MPAPEFGNSVFINCPFDREYKPILEAMLFCIVYLDLFPRIATESKDSAPVRLDKIVELIKAAKYSIHDLSRAEAATAGEVYRLNMPFELGVDYACRLFYGSGRDAKKLLILEAKPYHHHKALSDLAGCDAEVHGNDFQNAVRKVRNWLRSEAGIEAPGARKILNAYFDFQEWNYERLLREGFDDADIKDYPTVELMDAMRAWVDLGRPV